MAMAIQKKTTDALDGGGVFMYTATEASINTGVLFISTFYGVNAVICDRRIEEFSLPTPYTSSRENKIALQVLRDSQDRMGSFLNTQHHISFCILTIKDKAVLIGPYRTETVRASEVSSHLFESKVDRDTFLAYHKNLPLITPAQIKLVVRTIFVALFGPEADSGEQEINMQTYGKGELPPIPEFRDTDSEYLSIKNTGMMFYYIEQVQAGNFEKALGAYHKMMHGRGSTFSLVDVVEGTSRLRTLTIVALHKARVPDASANALLDDFKFKIRLTANLSDTNRHNERMIEQSCALVRSNWCSNYSQSIGVALDYIHRNLSRPISVAEIAEAVNLTPNCFSTKFHDEVGIPATAYINKQRMRTAAGLLVYTNLGISNICTHVGMLDGNYFSRCFKKEYGVSPTEFRKAGKLPDQ